jgi:hypothetical protein
MTSTNLRKNGEVSHRRRLAVNEHTKGPWPAFNSTAVHGVHRVIEDGMVWKRCELSRENLRGAAPVFMMRKHPKSRSPQEVRVLIVASKRSNVRGAKEHRTMEAR